MANSTRAAAKFGRIAELVPDYIGRHRKRSSVDNKDCSGGYIGRHRCPDLLDGADEVVNRTDEKR
jgi:hypothetical protein